MAQAVGSSDASTITRASGSVPGAHRILPSLPSCSSARRTAAHTTSASPNRSRLATRIQQHLGNSVIASLRRVRSSLPVAATTSRSSIPVSKPSPVGAKSEKMTCPDCSPPSTAR